MKTQWDIIGPWGKKNWFMLQHEYTLKMPCQVNGANHKGLHIVWSHPYEMFSISKTENRFVISKGWDGGLGMEIDSKCVWVFSLGW